MTGLAVSMRRMLDLVQTAERSGLSIEQFVVLYKEQLSKQEAASLNVLVSPSRPGTPPRAPASHCGSLSGPPSCKEVEIGSTPDLDQAVVRDLGWPSEAN